MNETTTVNRGPAAAIERFHASLNPRLSRTALWFTLGVVLVGFAAFAWLAPLGFELGDGPLYAEYIESASLDYAPKHIGYYALGIAFTRLVPLQLDHALNLMSALFAAAALGLVSAISYVLTSRVVASVAAVTVAASTYLFATNAVNAEMYVVQLAFLLAAVLFVLLDRPYATAASFAAALLITPSTILVVPFLVLLRPSPRFVGRWLIIGGAVSALLLIPWYRDYLWGDHGVLNMPAANLSGAEGLAKEFREIGEFSLSLVLVAIGFAALVAKPALRVLLAALVALWLPALVFGERYSDVPVQMPFYAFLAVVAGIGVTWLVELAGDGRTGIAIVSAGLVLAVAVTATPSYRRVAEETAATNEYRKVILAMGQELDAGDVAVAPFATSRLCQHYLGEESSEWIDDESLAGSNGPENAAQAQLLLTQALSNKKRIWLPGNFDPTAVEFFRSQGYDVSDFETIYVAVPVR